VEHVKTRLYMFLVRLEPVLSDAWSKNGAARVFRKEICH